MPNVCQGYAHFRRASAGLLAAALFGLAHPAAACTELTPRLFFCGEPEVWTARKSNNADVVGAYRRGPVFRVNFLNGDVGSDYDWSLVKILGYQLQTYADFMGVPVDTMEILARDEIKIDGIAGRRIAFPITVDKSPFVVAVSAVIGPEDNLQVVTVLDGKRFTSKHRRWHDEILSQTQFLPAEKPS